MIEEDCGKYLWPSQKNWTLTKRLNSLNSQFFVLQKMSPFIKYLARWRSMSLKFLQVSICSKWSLNWVINHVLLLTWTEHELLTIVTIMCRNDELSLTMSWVGCLLKDSELFILFAENSQILLKISVITILLSFMYLVAPNLFVNNQLNSSSNSIHHYGT